MDIDAEITEGRVVIGTSNRTQTECIFEVRARIDEKVKYPKTDAFLKQIEGNDTKCEGI